MKRTLILLCVIGLSCQSGNDLTIAERQRRELAPDAARWLIEAERAYDRGVYELALMYTDSVEASAADLADVHYLRGHIYTNLNRLDIAHAAHEKVIEVDPAYPGARFHMGVNSFRRGKLRDAIRYYLAEAAEVAPTTQLYHELGRAYAKLGVPDSARWAYEEAISLDSTNTMAYMWLGQLLEEGGQVAEALGYSLKGLALRPDDLDYQYIVGTQYLRLLDHDSARIYLEPIARAWPWHHGAQYNLGQVYRRLGKEDEARRYEVRADSAQQMQQQINEAEDAINHDPDNLDNWIRLGTLLRESGQYARAIEAFKVAAVNMPWNLILQVNLATLEMENGDLEAAIARYRAVLSADAELTDAWLNLGVAYANNTQYAAARAAWEQVLRMDPANPAARSHLSQLDALDESESSL
ncbi:MAG: tetratricopeptide repeat protein [Bacteroidota bacterium]|nr:tetratricopeptide repeat protein [Bacteroidota bacterium]